MNRNLLSKVLKDRVLVELGRLDKLPFYIVKQEIKRASKTDSRNILNI